MNVVLSCVTALVETDVDNQLALCHLWHVASPICHHNPFIFSYSSPATWNSISTSLKNCSSLYSFKCHLKSHLMAQIINN